LVRSFMPIKRLFGSVLIGNEKSAWRRASDLTKESAFLIIVLLITRDLCELTSP
jgi:hypothetical protein